MRSLQNRNEINNTEHTEAALTHTKWQQRIENMEKQSKRYVSQRIFIATIYLKCTFVGEKKLLDQRFYFFLYHWRTKTIWKCELHIHSTQLDNSTICEYLHMNVNAFPCTQHTIHSGIRTISFEKSYPNLWFTAFLQSQSKIMSQYIVYHFSGNILYSAQ